MADARIETQRGVRDDLVDTLSRELLGPSDDINEFLRQRPTGRYLVGRLAPARVPKSARKKTRARPTPEPAPTIPKRGTPHRYQWP